MLDIIATLSLLVQAKGTSSSAVVHTESGSVYTIVMGAWATTVHRQGHTLTGLCGEGIDECWKAVLTEGRLVYRDSTGPVTTSRVRKLTFV